MYYTNLQCGGSCSCYFPQNSGIGGIVQNRLRAPNPILWGGVKNACKWAYIVYECPQRKLKKMPKWWKTEEDPAILPRQWPRKLDKNRLWEKHCQIIQDLPPIHWNLPTGMGSWGANMRREMRCWLWKYPHHFLVKAVDRDGPGLQPHPDPLKVNSC